MRIYIIQQIVSPECLLHVIVSPQLCLRVSPKEMCFKNYPVFFATQLQRSYKPEACYRNYLHMFNRAKHFFLIHRTVLYTEVFLSVLQDFHHVNIKIFVTQSLYPNSAILQIWVDFLFFLSVLTVFRFSTFHCGFLQIV